MDPKQAECLGLYLYGAGYFARDENTLGLLTGRGTSEPHFCLSCPKRAECEDEHEQRVRQFRPAQVESFEARMRQGVRRGLGATLVAAYLGRKGEDPFAIAAVENFNRGHADRGRKDGPLVR